MANETPIARLRIFTWPWATMVIVALHVVIGIQTQKGMEWGLAGPLLEDFSFQWIRFQSNPILHAPHLISYAFLHAGTSHLLGNLLFFILFAPAVEMTLGAFWFFCGYLAWGAIAALTQGFFDPFGGGIIGSSGAISGAAGAFFVLFPLRFPPRIVGKWLGRVPSKLPAFFLIGLWFLWQLRQGLSSLAVMESSISISPIAYWAHIGGFAAGSFSVVPWLLRSKN